MHLLHVCILYISIYYAVYCKADSIRYSIQDSTLMTSNILRVYVICRPLWIIHHSVLHNSSYSVHVTFTCICYLLCIIEDRCAPYTFWCCITVVSCPGLNFPSSRLQILHFEYLKHGVCVFRNADMSESQFILIHRRSFCIEFSC